MPTSEQHAGPDRHELTDTIFPLAEAFRRMFARVDDLWSEAGLNPSEAAVIERLHFYHHGSARSGDLLGNPVRSTAAMGYVLANLEAKGLVTRSQDDTDRRAVIVESTSAGAELYATMVERILDHVVEPATLKLRPSDLTQLRRITDLLDPPALRG